MYILIIFSLIFLYKLVTNIINYKKVEKFSKRHEAWITKGDESFPTYKNEIINLFKDAGIDDAFVPFTEPAGLGFVNHINASIFTNFPSRYNVLAAGTISMFEEAIGVYRFRIKECFNPLYWIDQIIFMPKNLLLYMQLDSDKTSFKILNVLWSFIWWIIVAILSLFKIEIKTIIIKMINNMIK